LGRTPLAKTVASVRRLINPLEESNPVAFDAKIFLAANRLVFAPVRNLSIRPDIIKPLGCYQSAWDIINHLLQQKGARVGIVTYISETAILLCNLL
jgi:hypothetical protein